MSRGNPPPNEAPIGDPRHPLLERITAVVLVLVLLSLAWMAGADWRPA